MYFLSFKTECFLQKKKFFVITEVTVKVSFRIKCIKSLLRTGTCKHKKKYVLNRYNPMS